ncbi:hypothetical protein [Puerhibacterium puerhi]|uniref:hypothetical protein n=1 Tax=Puerhibacterium puerhi TaxID=2692623 RepID=UPI0019167CC4|nr:hypothetical protein [Puerhibacterium puerhi]
MLPPPAGAGSSAPPPRPSAPPCEAPGAWPWTEPASATSSLAFVVAGAWILVAARRTDGAPGRTTLGALTVLIGVGSVVQHGPAPAWNPVVHDPPLFGALALVAADAVAELRSRPVRARWWVVPTLAEVGLAAAAPAASVVAQVLAAGAAVGATLLRARARPAVRRRLLAAAAVLGVGALVGELSRPGRPLCAPGGWWDAGLSGHAVWHVLAAGALVVLAPAVGSRLTPATPPGSGTR